jgi:hypothetical protein
MIESLISNEAAEIVPAAEIFQKSPRTGLVGYVPPAADHEPLYFRAPVIAA